jgi:hypothetical protein
MEYVMRRFPGFLGIALLGVTAMFVSGRPVQAGRVGGPASEVGVILPYDTVFFDVDFAAGTPAVVSTIGNGNTNLELFLYDADGHVSPGIGFGDRKTAAMRLYRGGTLRLVIRNTGPFANTVLVSTN